MRFARLMHILAVTPVPLPRVGVGSAAGQEEGGVLGEADEIWGNKCCVTWGFAAAKSICGDGGCGRTLQLSRFRSHLMGLGERFAVVKELFEELEGGEKLFRVKYFSF